MYGPGERGRAGGVTILSKTSDWQVIIYNTIRQ